MNKVSKLLGFVIIMILLCLDCITSYAHHTEKRYIAELSGDVGLFDMRQDVPSINVLSYTELQEYLALGIVEWYEEDFEVELFDADVVNEATSETIKWDLEMINANRAKELLCEGQEIRIGIIDSGITYHPVLKDNIEQGYNYLALSKDVMDNIGHGTFVGGLIAANSNPSGIAGVVDEAILVPLKCFDTGYTTTVSVICNAIRDAVDVYDCDIINMSLGLTAYSRTLEEYIDYATDSGVIVVAAVGNKGTDALYYPAAYERVIGIGSVDKSYSKSDFSQYNSSVDFVAPGKNVWSTTNDGYYGQKSGTSFSTPLAVGMIAAMMNVDNTLTHDEIVALMSQTATVRDEWHNNSEYQRNDSYGYGLINISQCLNVMTNEHRYFMSPIDAEENITQVAVLNNTDTEFTGYCMWAEYTERGMLSMDWEYMCIPPGGYAIADTYITSNKIKCFIWQSIDDISVIADFREK